MSERLVVDSIMTADGEVVPLGPVDKDGHRVPLDTGELYGEDGKCITVGYFLYFPFTNEWFVEEMLSRSRFGVSELHLKAPDRGVRNWSVGSMTLMRRYDGEPIVRLELDTSVMLDVSVNGSCGDCVSADVTADAYIEDIKYCPFCGEEL